MRYLLTFLLSLFSICLFAQLPLCNKGGKYGLCREGVKEIVPPVYDTILPLFHEDSTGISFTYLGFTGGKINYITLRTDTVMDIDQTGNAKAVPVPVRGIRFEGGSFHLLDTNGKIVLKDITDVELSWRNDDRLIWKRLRSSLPLSGFELHEYGIAQVNKKWGVIARSGKTVLPFQFDSISFTYFVDEPAYQVMQGGKTGFYTINGKLRVPVKYDAIRGAISENNMPGYNYLDTTKYPSQMLVVANGKMGLIDAAGKELIPPRYTILVPYSRDRFIFNTGGTYKRFSQEYSFETWVLTPEGNEEPVTVKQVMWDSIIIGGKFGVVNGKGQEIIPARYNFISINNDGVKNSLLYRCVSGGKEHDDHPTHVNDGYGDYKTYHLYTGAEFVTGGKTVLLDAQSREICPGHDNVEVLEHYITPPIDDEPGERNVYFLAEKKGKKGVFNVSQQPLVPVKYDEIILMPTIGSRFLFQLKENGKYGLANEKGKLAGPVKYDTILWTDVFPYYNTGGKKIQVKEPVYLYETNSFDTVETQVLAGGKYGLLNWEGKEVSTLYDTLFRLHAPNSPYGPFFVQVKLNNKFGILDSAGKPVVPAEYDQLKETYSYKERLHANRNGKWGLVRIAGGTMVECMYDKELATLYNHYDCYVAELNGNRGLIDTAGKTLIPFLYDEFTTGYPYGTERGIYVVEKNKKLGIFDMKKGKETITPAYDYIFPSEYIDSLLLVNSGAKDMLPDRYDPRQKYQGGKWGMMNREGKIIVPVEYLYPPQFNFETATLKGSKGDGSADYFTLSGEKLADGHVKWQNTWLGRRSKIKTQPLPQPEWRSANGPEGCDATAFYLDKKGNYWLGTGSSGGVYFSDDKGKSWVEKNKGIGPVHVKLMGAFSDTIYMRASGTGYEEPMEQFETYFDSTSDKMYFFDPRRDSWTRVMDPAKADSIGLLLTEQTREHVEKVKGLYNPVLADKTRDCYFAGFEYHQCDELLNHKGFEQHVGDSLKDSVVVYTTNFPKDVFTLRAGNYHPVPGGTLILGKSGVFNFNGSTISRLGSKKLVASDVTQLVPLSEDAYFAKIGTSDIWFYSGKKWLKLLDAYTEHNKVKTVSYGGYNTGWLNPSGAEKIMFNFCGNLYEMDKTGKRELVLAQGLLDDQVSRFVPLNAARDESNPGMIYGIAFIVDNPDDWFFEDYNDQTQYGLFAYNSATKKLTWVEQSLFTTNYSQVVPQVVKDPAGKLWVCTMDSIARLENGKLIYSGLGKVSLRPSGIAFGKNGEIAISGGRDLLCVYDPVSKKWIKVLTPVRAVIDALGFDANGNLFAGCNYEFEYYCGGKGKLADPGLFYLQFAEGGPLWHKLNRGINDRVLSIVPHSKGLAVGTCGSGMCILKFD